jgi:hypothetical protein
MPNFFGMTGKKKPLNFGYFFIFEIHMLFFPVFGKPRSGLLLLQLCVFLRAWKAL